MYWLFSHILHAYADILNDLILKTTLMGSTVIIPILWMRKLRHKEDKHSSKWAAGDLADTWVTSRRVE